MANKRYKLTFAKAHDSVIDDEKLITDFFVSKGWVVASLSSVVLTFKLNDLVIKVFRYSKTILSYVKTEDPITFDYSAKLDNDILKFFDELGYRMQERNEKAGVSITDWFNKAYDSAFDNIDQVLRVLGYELEKEKSGYDVYRIIQDDKLIHVNVYSDKTIDKWTYSKSISLNDRVLFTDEELKLLDSIGWELTEEHTAGTDQAVEDWFTKATDSTKTKRYRFKFKAHDAERLLADDKRDITDFLTSQGWELKYNGHKLLVFEKGDSMLETSLSMKTVNQMNRLKTPVEHEKLDNNLLKFFDSLNYDIRGVSAEVTKQNITDWFTKAYDAGLTDIEKIVVWYSQNSKITNFRKIVNKKKPEEVRFNFTRDEDHFELVVNTVDKTVEIYVFVSSKFWELVNMTSYELAFFDKLGYDLSRNAKDVTDQEITDWFTKAYDSSSDEKNNIVKFMNSQGWVTLSAGTYTTLFKKDNSRFYVRFERREIYQTTVMGSYELIDDVMLKYFDRLNYHIARSVAETTGQTTESWFTKAYDSMTVEQLARVVTDGLTSRNYDLTYDQLNLPDEDNPEVITNTMTFTDGPVYLEVDFDAKEISKYNSGRNLPFEDWELELFDKLGFKLTSFHEDEMERAGTPQTIESWFKANDSVEPVDSPEYLAIMAAYETQQKKDPEMSGLSFSVTDKPDVRLILYEAPHSFNIRDYLRYEVYVNLKTKTARKYNSGNRNFSRSYWPFKDWELKIFDDVNFKLLNTDQKTTDWFDRKAYDSTKTKKYRLRFPTLNKAYDSLSDIDKALAWYRSLPWALDAEKVELDVEFDEVTIQYRDRLGNKFRVVVYPSAKQVANLMYLDHVDEWDHEVFDETELEFFDRLGYSLTNDMKKETRQSITDWFDRKAYDSMSVEQFLTARGYEDVTDLAEEEDFIGDGWKAYAEKTGDSETGYRDVIGVNESEKLIAKAASYFDWDMDHNGKPSDVIVMTDWLTGADFTNEELKFFDQRGYSIEDEDSDQNIEDWFGGEDSEV